MSYSIITRILRGLTKVSFAAGVLLLGLTVSGAQAAIVTPFSGNASEAAWTAAAGALGPFVTETFDTDQEFADRPGEVAWGTINYGTTVPNPGFPDGGHIHGGDGAAGFYHDRANTLDPVPGVPLLTFAGLGAWAFGADWDFGPFDPGTGIELLITFTDDSVYAGPVIEILNPLPGTFVGFFGIVSDMAIRSIQLLEGSQQQNNFESFNMDNARIAAVPIPAALPLFLSALAALGFLGRRRKQLATA